VAERRATAADDVRRRREDLEGSLSDRLDMLLVHAAAFDGGSEHFANAMALDLRVLLLDSLLAKLRLLDQTSFYDSALPFRAENVFPHHGLVVVGDDAIFPVFDAGSPIPRRTLRWRSWSSAIVMSSHEGALFSRKRLIQDVANLEGAHEDFDLPPDYHSLTRGIGLGYCSKFGGVCLPFRPDGVPVGEPDDPSNHPSPVPPAIRQLAHETLVSIALSSPGHFPRQETVETLLTRRDSAQGIRGMYMKRATDEESREPLSWIFNHPVDPALLGTGTTDEPPG
jgi:hypothetical protein